MRFTPTRPTGSRIDRQIEVQLKDIDASHPFISTCSETINISEYGILMEVPSTLDACVQQEVVASLTWEGGSYESLGEIVRFEGPYWKDPTKSVMAIRLKNALPSVLLTPRD